MKCGITRMTLFIYSDNLCLPRNKNYNKKMNVSVFIINYPKNIAAIYV